VPEQDPVLVDTDVASALYLEHYYGRRVSASLARSLTTRQLAVSLITLGEAHYGVPLADEVVAAEYGYLRASTESVGQPIADNDLWIAACGTANGLPLARSTGGTSSRSRSSA
jgi:predicted nucleic acid-binding protein